MTQSVIMETEHGTGNAEQEHSLSVVVVTYNSSWERVRATLNSVLLQKGIDFDVFVTDDGSEENHFDKIEALFRKYSFTKYRLISQEKNQRTVLNFLDAVKQSKSDYIRGLGQGDIFFDEYALRDSYTHALSTKADVTISKAVFYEASTRPMKLIAYRRYPQNIDAYKDVKQLRLHYLMFRDIASGSTAFYKREVLLEYLNEEAKAGVKYLEDYIYFLMIFDGLRFSFFDKNIVYYEYGMGVSTSTVYWDNLLIKDGDVVFDLLLKRCEGQRGDPFVEKLRFIFKRKKEGTFPLPLMNWRFSVKILEKGTIADVERKYELLKEIEKKYQEPLPLWERVCRRIELLKVPEAFFFLLRMRFYPKKLAMTDTNVSTAFAELCLSQE